MRFTLTGFLAAIFAFSLIVNPAVGLAADGKTSDWPQFHGPKADNTTTEAGWKKDWPADGPAVLWKANVGKGLASCAVVGDKVYTAGNDGADMDTILCLDLNTGKEVWKHSYKCVTATHPMPIVPYGPASTPTVLDDRVFTLSREGDVFCLDAEKGTVIWQKNLVKDFQGKRPVYGYSNSVLAKCGYVFLDAGGDVNSTVCLDQKNGKTLWAKGKGEAGYATPAFASFGTNGGALVLFKGEALTILDPISGDQLASYATTTRDFSNCATPYIQGNKVFISHTGAEGSTVLTFDNNKLTPAWTDRDLGLLFNSGVPWDGKLIVFNDQKRGVKDLRCLDLATGKAVWTSDQIEKGTAILSDGHLIVLTNAGEVVLAKPGEAGLEILHQAQVLPGKGYVLPVLSQHRLLCKNNAGDLVCLDLR